MNFLKLKQKPKGGPSKDSPSKKPLFLVSPFVNTSIADGSFKKIVPLPPYVDENEWLAVHTFDFFTYLNLFYGSIKEFCTAQSCPTMGAGRYPEYQWVDPHTKSKPRLSTPAPTYIDYCMTWIQNIIYDETIFPTKSGIDFPRDFNQTVKSMFKQYFRVFAHIYHHHYEQVLHLREEGHLNAFFAHFIAFSREFHLLERKDTQALDELIDIMEADGAIS